MVAGHSYGGQVITALGADAPNVVGLVYVAAFGLDQGESIGQLLASGGPPTPALAHLDIDDLGFARIPEDDFVEHFASGIDPVTARVMYAVQQPLATSTLGDVMGVPAWKSYLSWYLVAANDEAIPPDAERQFAARMGATTVEVATGHVAMVSHPDDVAQLIVTAAEAVATAGAGRPVADGNGPAGFRRGAVQVDRARAGPAARVRILDLFTVREYWSVPRGQQADFCQDRDHRCARQAPRLRLRLRGDHGGTRSAWDYGPLGVELKENIKRQWWRAVVTGREDVVGLEAR